jgi:hypothetical protein
MAQKLAMLSRTTGRMLAGPATVPVAFIDTLVWLLGQHAERASLALAELGSTGCGFPVQMNPPDA